MSQPISYHVDGSTGVTPPCHDFSVPREAVLSFTTDQGESLEITMTDEVWEFVLVAIASMHAKRTFNLR